MKTHHPLTLSFVSLLTCLYTSVYNVFVHTMKVYWVRNIKCPNDFHLFIYFLSEDRIMFWGVNYPCEKEDFRILKKKVLIVDITQEHKILVI